MVFTGLVELREKLAEIHHLDRARMVLWWDEHTMMPPAGASARADQLATLERLRHQSLSSPQLGRLLDGLISLEEALPEDSDEALIIRSARRDHDRAVRVPARLKADISRAGSLGEHAWWEARARSDFSLLLPHLERNLELKQRYVECFDADDPYDVLLDDFERDMRTADMERVLLDLKVDLLPLLAEVRANTGTDTDSPLQGEFPIDQQRAFVMHLLRSLPMPPECWRMDETTHPFATAFSPGDVRITTRYSERNLAQGLFGALHEFGHGLYENGIDPSLEGTPLCRPASLGIHESQSRLWENLVGRGREFWGGHYYELQHTFPEEFGGLTLDDFHRAVNQVQPSLIRVEADQLTYDLHVLLRFELERELFAGTLAPRELPAAWNEGMHTYLGVEVPSDAEGVLQDPHWAEGMFGYFPTYSLGNVIAGQLWAAAHEALPSLDDQIEHGDLWPLREWLREHVHQFGRRLTPTEIVEHATGRPIEVAPYVKHLREKFGALYGVESHS